MHRAVRSASAQTVSLLLKAGADLAARNEVGQTPLIRVASLRRNSPRIQIIDILVNAGADVDAVNHGHKTALHCLASENTHVRSPQQTLAVIKLLMQAGASIELPDCEGKTALALFSLDPKFRAALIDMLAWRNSEAER